MNDPSAGAPVARKCRLCGMAIVAPPFARAREGYCCEGCFLAARKQQTLAEADDAPYFALAEALVAALDAREHETGLHSKRVARHALALVKHVTHDPQRLRQVYWGALLHDIGKIGIPGSILLKRGSLSDAEWAIMRTHPEIGHRILAGVPFMAEAAEIVLDHEERYDGRGYPRGLAGSAIPLSARLFALIDTLDAITSERPYRGALAFDAARAEITRASGSQFDPMAVEIFAAEETTLRNMVELKCSAIALQSASNATARTGGGG